VVEDTPEAKAAVIAATAKTVGVHRATKAYEDAVRRGFCHRHPPTAAGSFPQVFLDDEGCGDGNKKA
jgi:hypothetical protein